MSDGALIAIGMVVLVASIAGILYGLIKLATDSEFRSTVVVFFKPIIYKVVGGLVVLWLLRFLTT